MDNDTDMQFFLLKKKLLNVKKYYESNNCAKIVFATAFTTIIIVRVSS